MADRVCSSQSLTAVADAIRSKGGTTETLEFPTGFVSAINAIPSDGGDLHIKNVNIPEPVSQGNVNILLHNDSFIAENYNNERLFVLLYAQGVDYAEVSGTKKFHNVLTTNGIPIKNDLTQCSMTFYVGAKGITPYLDDISQNLRTVVSGKLWINDSGGIYFRTGSTYGVLAGNYIIIYGLAPTEEDAIVATVEESND